MDGAEGKDGNCKEMRNSRGRERGGREEEKEEEEEEEKNEEAEK